MDEVAEAGVVVDGVRLGKVEAPVEAGLMGEECVGPAELGGGITPGARAGAEDGSAEGETSEKLSVPVLTLKATR